MRPIDADALKGAITKATDVVKGKGYDELTHIFDGFIDLVDRMPAVDVPDRKVGKWIWEDSDERWGWACSNCGYGIRGDRSKTNYCPNCGAEMFDKDTNVRSKGEDDG